jgi:hypothetical protein
MIRLWSRGYTATKRWGSKVSQTVRGCDMTFPRIALRYAIFGMLFPVSMLAQQSPPVPAAPVREFPVVLQQNVVAGKTPVGTKVKAKLTVATLENGTVIPRNAVFSGEVLESAEKTSADPSRLTIRMDSAVWKDGTAPIKAYLTAWYYPPVEQSGQDLQYGPTQSAKGTWNGAGEYPGPNTHVYRPFPTGDSDPKSSIPETPNSVPGSHRVAMKDIDSENASDGAIALVSKHRNIKLDHFTTYVLVTGDAVPAK